MGDQEIILSFKSRGRKKEAAVKYFIEKQSHYILKITRKTSLEKSDVIDCYSDAIVHLIQQVREDKFRGESKLSSYFYRIFYNKCVDLSRKKTTNIVTDDFSQIVSKEDPQDKMEIQQDFNVLQKKLSVIGDVCKKIVMDWGYFGYSMDEIAKRNNLQNAKQAKDRKYKCLKKLRELLNPNQHGRIK